jgi:hypothetical protein
MSRKIKLLFLVFLFAVKFATAQDKKTNEVFIVKPYLQIGRNPSPQTLQLLWHVADTDAEWIVEYKNINAKSWKKTEAPKIKMVTVAGLESHRIYEVLFTDLEPGGVFSYKVSKQKKVVFTADAHAMKKADQPFRFLAFGDCGAGTPEQKPLANRAYLSNADLVVIPGDMVYEHGLVSEYRTKFWPVYNADKADEAGAPLLRSIPFVASPGNHDTDTRDLDKYPDGLAYYLVWNQPLNGPLCEEGSASVPKLISSDINRKPFIDAAGDAYPRMTNFSFDYGNAHWTFLDSNPYVDWTNSDLLKWVANDLAASKHATWRFIVFHHPGFNSSREHFEQQQMRLLSPVFEAGNVDVVFSGHVHNYQRSFPLKFAPDKKGTLLVGGKEGKTLRGRVVNGKWTLDKSFDGVKDTTPEGIIYIVTGAGGQELYNTEQNDDSDSWQKFTTRFVSTSHSLTVADVDGENLTIRQLKADGTELDKIVITKDAVASEQSAGGQ